ncbi:MAG: excinuclease ABC subunit UvrB, partial [Paludibacteraceae bacterium]|nr:excinuclease ABC subunit UvrB [Paludibacteraceae bacterium]
LLGVTGSGKTFTIANVIEKVQKPTLVLSHNKTLAAQLYSEFKKFFPNNAVEYFVSYYDYYQPEAYIPQTDTYIEKDLAINEEIDRLRLSATAALLSGRKDVIVVSSVSCLYGIGNPEYFTKNCIEIKVGQKLVHDLFLRQLVSAMYTRDDLNFGRCNFRVKGDTVDIWLSHTDLIVRVIFWGDEIESIELLDALSLDTIEVMDQYVIAPANIFVTTQDNTHRAIREIELDLGKRIAYFESQDRMHEAKLIEERTNYDLEMIRELGYCSGIENYSRYFDGREEGTPPYCLMDFFPKDYLLVIDESHVTIPQIHAMYGGDRARKKSLVEYGYRLPAAYDNRPLKFEEFQAKCNQVIYVSATPAEYELEQSGGVVVEQVIRPTGLVDPPIEIRPTKHQIDDLLDEIAKRAEKDERVLVTTLTKRMAEELTEYLLKSGVRCTYIHSEVDTLERVKILDDLRAGLYDVLIGVNLLREGIDLPQVSLVAILDADKEGFLRSHRALTQTAGRAARNVNGLVIMYADHITDSMQQTIDETERRRSKQLRYNEEHHISPKTAGAPQQHSPFYKEPEIGDELAVAADPVLAYMNSDQLEKAIAYARKKMLEASAEMDFLQAAQYRDEMRRLEKLRN